jgi:hypothetical protein
MKTYFRTFFIFAIIVLSSIPSVSFATDISFVADKSTIAVDEDFLVNVFLDTKNVSINAVGGTIAFPYKLLELKEVRDGNSAINFWVEKPHVSVDGQVIFSGITTGGFSGEKIFLFSLVFRPKVIATGSIVMSDIKVLKNDGLGTLDQIKLNSPFYFNISRESNISEHADLTVIDTGAPEIFTPFIGSDPALFDGKKFVVFSTVDKGSGIDHYEVRQSFWGLGGDYVVAESPFLITDQSGRDTIYVKAVDKSKNERIVKFKPENRIALLEQWIILGILVFVCIFFLKKIRSKSAR